ncbi:hypothetical protein LshimejAT787_1800180 [Lyophyllum shimeji]|uniref:Uncharacterized protein n=1 Tax=Lyophyllum shimeji TaxID=47721 RepID=A0A9P3UW16_LYOSH|nr:hypothetical protein LshimejAT787_1800180 [Lyophyllum shimeji]
MVLVSFRETFYPATHLHVLMAPALVWASVPVAHLRQWVLFSEIFHLCDPPTLPSTASGSTIFFPLEGPYRGGSTASLKGKVEALPTLLTNNFVACLRRRSSFKRNPVVACWNFCVVTFPLEPPYARASVKINEQRTGWTAASLELSGFWTSCSRDLPHRSELWGHVTAFRRWDALCFADDVATDQLLWYARKLIDSASVGLPTLEKDLCKPLPAAW